MDIKRNRREAGIQRQQVDDDYPGTPPGSYAQGSAASDQNPYWWVRAQSQSEGVGTDYLSVQREGEEEHRRWGTPWEDVLPHPNGVPENVGYSGVASRNADDPLPNPCNFHSNPGSSTTTTAGALAASSPGGVYRTPGPRAAYSSGAEGHRPMRVGGRRREATPGRTIVPAGGARQPESEGGPLVVTTGFPGR